jgi:hypothetical protein
MIIGLWAKLYMLVSHGFTNTMVSLNIVELTTFASYGSWTWLSFCIGKNKVFEIVLIIILEVAYSSFIMVLPTLVEFSTRM